MTLYKHVVLPLLVLLTIFGASCSPGENGGTPGLTQTPTPSPLDHLKASGESMRNESTFHFNLQYDGQRGTPVLQGMELVSAEGDFNAGDAQMNAGIRLTQVSLFVVQKVISKDGETYLSDPVTARWSKAPPDQVPCALANINNLVADLAQEALSATFRGTETLDSRPARHLLATFPSESFAAVMCSTPETGTVDSDVWLDQQTGHILKVRLEGRINSSEPEGLVRTLTFSRFGQAVDIQAPSL